MITKLLDRIVYWASHHTRSVYLITTFLLVLTLLGFSMFFPGLDTDILALLPSKEPVVKDFKEAVRDFESIDYLLIMLRTKDPEGLPLDQVMDVADYFAEELETHPDVEFLAYNYDQFMPLLEDIYPYLLLYLPPEAMDDFKAHMTDEAIQERVALNKRILTLPESGPAKQMMTKDPLGLLPLAVEHLRQGSEKSKLVFPQGFFSNEKGDALLAIVKPTRPVTDLTFTKSFMASMKTLEAEARAEVLEETENQNLEVLFGGGYPITLADNNLIVSDTIRNTLASLALVTLLFLVCFRRLSSLIYAWLPLVVALVLAGGVALLFRVQLDSATAGAGALLIGLGIDFTIVMYGRYALDRSRGMDVDKAILDMLHGSGRAVVIGALTTAATFFSLMVTRFDAMRTLGWITGLGIFCTMAVVLTLLPAMLHTHQRFKEKQKKAPKFQLHAFGLERIVDLGWNFPKTVLVVAALSMVPIFFLVGEIRFVDNVDDMRAPDNAGVVASRAINNAFGAPSHYMMVVNEAKTLDESLIQAEQVRDALQPFLDRREILFTFGMSSFLPSSVRQNKAIESLAKGREDGSLDPERIRASFVAACKEQGFKVDAFVPAMDRLDQALTLNQAISMDDLESAGLKKYVEKFYLTKNGTTKVIRHLHIDSKFKREAPEGLVEAIHQKVPSATVTGMNIVSKRVRAIIKVDVFRSALLGLVFVLILIALDFRSPFKGALTLLPLILGIAWMLTLMVLFKQPLNLMNIFVSSMIIGIGVDYALHSIHRFDESNRKSVKPLKDVAKAIVMAALTTSAGFGSMALSSYPGLRSVGFAALLGTLAVMLATLLVLPAIFSLIHNKPMSHQTTAEEDHEQA